MENFNDLIWDRYQELRKKVTWLKQRYVVMVFIVLLQALSYVYVYFQYFK